MKSFLAALALTIAATGAVEAKNCTNYHRLKEFNAKRHTTGNPDFGRNLDDTRFIVVKHPSGIYRFSVYAKRGAVGVYDKSGTGEALPVSVSVSENLCKKGSTNIMTKKIHASLPMRETYALKSPMEHPDNTAAVQALAARVLAETYCRGGEIKKKYDHKYVDQNRGNPVVRTAPQIKSYPGSPAKVAWGVQLSCSLWRKIN